MWEGECGTMLADMDIIGIDGNFHSDCHFMYDVVPWYMFANFMVTVIGSAMFVCAFASSR